MKPVSILAAGLLTLSSAGVLAQAELVQQAKIENQTQQIHNQQREQGFKQTEQQLKALKASLAEKKAQLESQNDNLASQFSDNEVQLSQLEEQLRVETGSLGELFGVVRQHAKEIKADLAEAVTAIGQTDQTQVVNDIVEANTLPDIRQLRGLWQVMQAQISASRSVSELTIAMLDAEGQTQATPALTLGNFGLLTEQGYVNWHHDKQFASSFAKLPENVPVRSDLVAASQGEMMPVLLDPTRGVLLQQYAQSPGLAERFAAGGVVGKVIIGLLAIGLIIAAYRAVVLLAVQGKIKAQLKTPNTPQNNPLGRILAVYDSERPRSVEALELRLLEAIVDEQNGLEKGLSMLKLLAALAPMLGLLGTVIGMIETFQVITQFGNGDPKIMASGISMALVTTVLGLVAAMPLLLAHNILNGMAENVRNVLEKQSIGLVAQQAEEQMHTTREFPAKVGNAA
ncbi:flagellar motor protein MotA [Vibrio navarrensis]|uniref:MotA/TolQ/ExbB proton channel family protein n=1 Tax=Vibrio navarrensis TaxID=29495 RepID=UPI00130229FE|nr:MotA/TolQ/ExbB proton channel family protein [Vibrio navarrensis]MBE4577124.1 flagellar motor protein MotA [Vibrio navarrensis]MBE4596035.1 flagellar motor protein MotA [Vibrio navarrensis]MBE4618533.1 flagellar motor protein MotA [Vibrio navarrensis]MBH9739209.1 flagellar motor protein MotA [Vibrio navarrensis]